MNSAVVKYYRELLKTGFKYTGSFDNPTILLDSGRDNIDLCGQAADNAIHLYININNGIIDGIRYLCNCEPTVNVVIEFLCALVEGKTIADVNNLTIEAFSQALGSQDEEFLEKAKLAIEFINKGITKFGLDAT
jgi:NifU-like protein involved in Fe-S cluster formation